MYKIIGADQKQYGPVSADEIRQWIAEGRINSQTLLQADSQTDWRPLSSFPEFATVAQPMPSGVPLSAAPSTADAQRRVNGPATGLMVVGILCVLASLSGLVSNLIGGGGAVPPGNLPPQLQEYLKMMSGSLGLVVNFIALALAAFFIFASTKMKKLESYGLVVTATILSMIPCTSSCCCVGLPVGIWVLVVLMKPEVKSAFR